MDDFQMAWPFMIPIVGTICTFVYVIVLTLSRARVRELEVRERIAMIERGLVPPPEVDPRGFDRAMYRYDRQRSKSPGRHRRAGIAIMGLILRNASSRCLPCIRLTSITSLGVRPFR